MGIDSESREERSLDTVVKENDAQVSNKKRERNDIERTQVLYVTREDIAREANRNPPAPPWPFHWLSAKKEPYT